MQLLALRWLVAIALQSLYTDNKHIGKGNPGPGLSERTAVTSIAATQGMKHFSLGVAWNLHDAAKQARLCFITYSFIYFDAQHNLSCKTYQSLALEKK